MATPNTCDIETLCTDPCAEIEIDAEYHEYRAYELDEAFVQTFMRAEGVRNHDYVS